jgi:hypothetical protein
MSERKRQALRLLDQSKLAVASISTRPCFRDLDLLQNLTPASHSLDYVGAWYGSTCSMAILT